MTYNNKEITKRGSYPKKFLRSGWEWGPDVVHKRFEQRYWTLSLLRAGWASGRLYSRGFADRRKQSLECAAGAESFDGF